MVQRWVNLLFNTDFLGMDGVTNVETFEGVRLVESHFQHIQKLKILRSQQRKRSRLRPMFLAQGSRPARSPIGELPRTVPWGSQDAIENGPVTDWTVMD